MKLLIVTLLFVLIPSEDWLDDIENEIALVDSEAIMIKEKTFVNGDFVGEITRFKLKNNRLVTVSGNDTSSFSNEFNLKVYSNKQKIYASLSQFIVPHIYKGKRTANLPLAFIIEENSYFKNKNEGIGFYREIDIYRGDNIDSLKLALQKVEFEQKELSRSDYDNVKLFAKVALKFE